MSPPGATLGAALDTRRVRPFTWFGNTQDSVGGVKVLTPVWEKQITYRREVGGNAPGGKVFRGGVSAASRGADVTRGALCLHVGPTHGVARKGWLARGRGEPQGAWLPWVLRLFCILPKPGKAVWGESGELVCTKPIPCQPTHFWNDENGSKYRKAYFSRFPGTWAAGADSAWPGPRGSASGCGPSARAWGAAHSAFRQRGDGERLLRFLSPSARSRHGKPASGFNLPLTGPGAQSPCAPVAAAGSRREPVVCPREGCGRARLLRTVRPVRGGRACARGFWPGLFLPAPRTLTRSSPRGWTVGWFRTRWSLWRSLTPSRFVF